MGSYLKLPARAKDLSGRTFGKLTVGEWTALADGTFGWMCRCECGNSSTSDAYRLLSGKKKSCGCAQLVGLEGTYGHRKTHGCRHTKAYKTWSSMKERCLHPWHKSYGHYGGAGITICPRWLNSFENFLADMGHPQPGQTIDRIDNAKVYSPDNCRWASASQQQRNKSDNRLLTAFGETKCAAEWLDDARCQCNWTALYGRIRIGWDHERAISQPMKVQKNRTRGPGEKP